MAGVLNVVTTETYPKTIQFRESGVAKDLTGFTVTCKISTDPVTTKTVTVAYPESGTGTCIFNGLPEGTYNAEIIMTHTTLGVLPSEQFIINVRAGL